MLKLGEEAAVCISGNEELIAKYIVVNFVSLIFCRYIFFGERDTTSLSLFVLGLNLFHCNLNIVKP